MVKQIVHPVTGRKMFFGRRRPRIVLPHLRFENYTMRSLPTPPPVSDYYTTMVVAVLKQMLMNDQLGCCVASEMGHSAGIFTGNANGSAGASLLTDQQIVSLYSAISGYVPGDESTDNGALISDALAYWASTGILPGTSAPHKIMGSMSILGSNQEQVKSSISLFENNMIGFELPDEWINPMPSDSGFVWDVAGPPNPQSGHCVLAFSYDTLGVLISTWGMIGHVTWAALAKYTASSNGGELYTVISQDQISTAKKRAPNGFDFTQLQADFQALGGTIV